MKTPNFCVKKLLDIFPNMISESKICSQGLSLTMNSYIFEIRRSEIQNSPPKANKKPQVGSCGQKVFSLSFFMAALQGREEHIHSLTGKTLPAGCRPLGKLLNISVPQL